MVSRIPSKTALLTASALFRTLPEAMLADLAEAATLRQGTAEDLLFRIGDASEGVFLTVADAEPGPLVLVSFDDPQAQAPRRGFRLIGGEVLGDLELLLSGLTPGLPPRSVSVRLLRAQRLLVLPVEAVCRAAALCEPFRRRLIRDAARRILAQLADRTLAESQSPEIGFARKLLDFLDDFGSIEGNAGVLRDRMTQQQIADFLGMSLRLFSLRVSEWSQRGLLDTVPFALADLDRIERIAAAGDQTGAVAAAATYEAAMALIREGLAARGGRIASDALAIWPDNPALLHAQALSALRTGAGDQVRQLLQHPDMAWNGSVGSLRQRLRRAWSRSLGLGRDEDGEEKGFAGLEDRLCQDIGGLHGRLAKEAALAGGVQPAMEQAAEVYAEVDAGSPNSYCAINAATLFRLAGREEEAGKLARRVVSAAQGSGYWDLVTRGEALLVLDKADQAGPCFVAAAKVAALGEIGSTRKQLGYLAQAGVAGAAEALAVLHPGQPVCFSGMILRETDGSPAEVEAAAGKMRADIDRWLADTPTPLAFTGLAAGADIIFAEALQEAGVPYEVVLPFRAELFVRLSVAIGGGDWRSRFDDCLAAARRVTELHPEEVAKSAVERHFQRGNRHMLGETIFAAHQLAVGPRLLTLSRSDSGPAGSASLARDFAALGHEVSALAAPEISRRVAAAGVAQDSFAAVIFAFDPGGNDEAAVLRLLARHGLEHRRQKNRLLAGSVVMPSLAEALGRATVMAAEAAASGIALSTICDFGPVLRRGNVVDRDAVNRLEAAQGLAAAEPGGVFATTALAMPAMAVGVGPECFTEIAFGIVPGRNPRPAGEAARRVFRYHSVK